MSVCAALGMEPEVWWADVAVETPVASLLDRPATSCQPAGLSAVQFCPVVRSVNNRTLTRMALRVSRGWQMCWLV